MNSSDRYFLDAFNLNFKTFRNGETPIALYGIGEKTKLLLENIKGFFVIGLMDKDAVGKTIYGQSVLSYDVVIEKVKTIIIVANMSVAEIIYRRIAFLTKEHGIDILFINGTVPREVDKTTPNDAYWKTTKADLIRVIDENEVVSFDLFDTLIMRNVLLPTDVFDLVEKALAEKHGMALPFKNKRIEAEQYTFRNVDNYCTIHDIYRTLKGMLGINFEQEMMIKNLEIQTEYFCCIPRASMIECYRYALNRGKHVVITTDTFLTKEYVGVVLNKCDIEAPEKLLISCEERKLKYNGEMFHHLRALYGGSTILHVGDNSRSDGEMAKKAGMNTFEIRSSYGILDASALSGLLPHAKSIDDRKVLGRLTGKFLNDPFALNEHQGRLSIDSLFDIGFLSFGPLVLNFLLWLIQKSRENKIDRLLFFARDGYILKHLYRRLVEAFGIDAPGSIYFLTSRRAASVAGIKTETDIAFIVNNVCKIKKITINRLLFTAFGVRAHDDDSFAEKQLFEVTEESLVKHLNAHYREAIFNNAREEREQYLSYIHNLGIRSNETIGCVNFIGRGITQHFITNIMEKSLVGFYFATEHDMTDIFGSLDKIFALYGERLSPHTARSALFTKALFGEVVFSAPDEQLVRFDKNGRPIFEQRQAIRDFSMIGECHKGIEQFVEEMMELYGNISGMRINNELIDNLYGLFSSPVCVCSEEVKKSFVFNDYYNPDAPDVTLNLPDS